MGLFWKELVQPIYIFEAIFKEEIPAFNETRANNFGIFLSWLINLPQGVFFAYACLGLFSFYLMHYWVLNLVIGF